MRLSNSDYERADELARGEVEAGRACAARALAPSPATECADCGEPIPAARKAAMPSAERCVACAARVEGRR